MSTFLKGKDAPTTQHGGDNIADQHKPQPAVDDVPIPQPGDEMNRIRIMTREHKEKFDIHFEGMFLMPHNGVFRLGRNNTILQFDGDRVDRDFVRYISRCIDGKVPGLYARLAGLDDFDNPCIYLRMDAPRGSINVIEHISWLTIECTWSDVENNTDQGLFPNLREKYRKEDPEQELRDMNGNGCDKAAPLPPAGTYR